MGFWKLFSYIKTLPRSYNYNIITLRTCCSNKPASGRSGQTDTKDGTKDSKEPPAKPSEGGKVIPVYFLYHLA